MALALDQKVEPQLAFHVEGVGVRYRRFGASKSDAGLARVKKRVLGEWFWALDGVDFALNRGSVLGIVGHNGAGKSTLVRVISGLLPPDRGEVQINGTVSCIFSASAGFDPKLSGRDNVNLKCSYLGLSRKETKEHYDEIVEFAGLDGFMDMPVRTYSKGMKTRLGFSVATCIDPDILILDEVLGAGDREFKKRAEQRMAAMMERAQAIVLVSHSMKTIARLCTDVLWMDHGRVKMSGKTEDILKLYSPDDVD